jgi:hypothetical protein
MHLAVERRGAASDFSRLPADTWRSGAGNGAVVGVGVRAQEAVSSRARRWVGCDNYRDMRRLFDKSGGSMLMGGAASIAGGGLSYLRSRQVFICVAVNSLRSDTLIL